MKKLVGSLLLYQFLVKGDQKKKKKISNSKKILLENFLYKQSHKVLQKTTLTLYYIPYVLLYVCYCWGLPFDLKVEGMGTK